jgi:hypothetical protein
MIKEITIGHWKKQSLTAIEFIIKQISKIIDMKAKFFSFIEHIMSDSLFLI